MLLHFAGALFVAVEWRAGCWMGFGGFIQERQNRKVPWHAFQIALQAKLEVDNLSLEVFFTNGIYWSVYSREPLRFLALLSSIAHFFISKMKLSIVIFAAAFGLASAGFNVVSWQMWHSVGALVATVEWRAGWITADPVIVNPWLVYLDRSLCGWNTI